MMPGQDGNHTGILMQDGDHSGGPQVRCPQRSARIMAAAVAAVAGTATRHVLQFAAVDGRRGTDRPLCRARPSRRTRGDSTTRGCRRSDGATLATFWFLLVPALRQRRRALLVNDVSWVLRRKANRDLRRRNNLLTLLRWRQPEGQTLGCVSCAPHTCIPWRFGGLARSVTPRYVARTHRPRVSAAVRSALASQHIVVPRSPPDCGRSGMGVRPVAHSART